MLLPPSFRPTRHDFTHALNRAKTQSAIKVNTRNKSNL